MSKTDKFLVHKRIFGKHTNVVEIALVLNDKIVIPSSYGWSDDRLGMKMKVIRSIEGTKNPEYSEGKICYLGMNHIKNYYNIMSKEEIVAKLV